MLLHINAFPQQDRTFISAVSDKHSEIRKGMTYVGAKKVGKSYILKDKDIVELHMK